MEDRVDDEQRPVGRERERHIADRQVVIEPFDDVQGDRAVTPGRRELQRCRVVAGGTPVHAAAVCPSRPHASARASLARRAPSSVCPSRCPAASTFASRGRRPAQLHVLAVAQRRARRLGHPARDS